MEEPPLEEGREGAACRRAGVQRARVQQAEGAKKQAMGTQCLSHRRPHPGT